MKSIASFLLSGGVQKKIGGNHTMANEMMRIFFPIKLLSIHKVSMD
ncbi:hypothetical protein [Clostridium botulinum]|nr:hypothetical protein [Clostridium botulinum]